ncbi:hypothetical protein D910_02242 [Dendroctonus ponderosae]|uniref:Uncharacterized protein n=1 Tax=Dendroctonus ponderosae TaxID=77166 RepID=U4TXT7_DENPD|nr:hypothetical protein D910_02242 [Dendroctonus ponderosae]
MNYCGMSYCELLIRWSTTHPKGANLDTDLTIFPSLHLEQQSRVPPQKPRSFINQALKESGYESDSTLVFKRKEETAASQLSPKDQREVYKMIQKGGDVPFQGLRKPAPERPKGMHFAYISNLTKAFYNN